MNRNDIEYYLIEKYGIEQDEELDRLISEYENMIHNMAIEIFVEEIKKISTFAIPVGWWKKQEMVLMDNILILMENMKESIGEE